MMSKEQDNYSITEEQELALTKAETEAEQKMSTMVPEEREASALWSRKQHQNRRIVLRSTMRCRF